jgi:tellurium resistance protein TerD
MSSTAATPSPYLIPADISEIGLGFGWDMPDRLPIDLDISVFLISPAKHIPTPDHLVFYHNRLSPDGSVRHLGDNRSGETPGDDEVVEVRLNSIANGIWRVVITISAYATEGEEAHLGMLEKAELRIYDIVSHKSLVHFDLPKVTGNAKGMEVGYINRHPNGSWEFQPVLRPEPAGLNGFIERYG